MRKVGEGRSEHFAGPISMATIMLSWQQKYSVFSGKIGTVVGHNIACGATIHDVTSPMTSCVTLAVTSWRPDIVVSRHLGASAVFWGTLMFQYATFLSVCAGESQLGTPLAVR